MYHHSLEIHLSYCEESLYRQQLKACKKAVSVFCWSIDRRNKNYYSCLDVKRIQISMEKIVLTYLDHWNQGKRITWVCQSIFSQFRGWERIAVQAGKKSKTTTCASFKHTLLRIFIFPPLFSFLGRFLFTFIPCKQLGKDFCAIVYAHFSAGAQESGCNKNNDLMCRAYSAKRM